jgi:starch-binding outer membrane protein, SusD/RagB family
MMEKILKSKIIFAAGMFAMLLIASCQENLLEEKPPHLITTETLYTNLAGFETGINGLYALVREERTGLNNNSSWSRAETWMSGTDILLTNSENSGGGFGRIALRWGDELNPNTPYNSGVFAWLYRIVNTANTIINQAENRTDIDWTGGGNTPEQNRIRVIAEARAMRAWAYRHLSFGWGDVPLNLNEALGSTIKTDWARAPVSEVRKQIMADFLFAEKHIPVEPELQGKITKGAIQHYLAEMYLVLDKPDSTLYWADKVINTPEYKLVTQRYGVRANQPGVPFMDMFTDGNLNRNQGNTEALWVFQFAFETVGGGAVHMIVSHGSRYENMTVGGIRPFTSTVERGGRGSTRMSISKFALELYKWPDSGPITKSDIVNYKDDRMSPHAIRWFYILKDAEGNAPYAADRLPAGYQYGDTVWTSWNNPITFATRTRVTWPWSNKVAVGVNPKSPGSGTNYGNQVYLRLAETYLLKAEAQYLLNRPADAAETINIIRRRANASEITAGDVNIDFILDERARELIVEEDRRWTLLRTGKWIERTKLHNTNGGEYVTEREKLFPIPQDVIDANLTGVMTQNPGYF